MFYVWKMTLKNLDINFSQVEAIELTSTKAISVYLWWLLCYQNLTMQNKVH